MKTILSLSSLIILTACTPAPAAEEPQIKRGETNLSEQVLTGDYVGMSVPQAQEKAKVDNVPFRIVMADGEAFAVTMDYRPGRINATVENGVVVSYTTEGQER